MSSKAIEALIIVEQEIQYQKNIIDHPSAKTHQINRAKERLLEFETIRTALANAPQVVTVETLRNEYLACPAPRDENGKIMDVWTFLEKRANGLRIVGGG